MFSLREKMRTNQELWINCNNSTNLFTESSHCFANTQRVSSPFTKRTELISPATQHPHFPCRASNSCKEISQIASVVTIGISSTEVMPITAMALLRLPLKQVFSIWQNHSPVTQGSLNSVNAGPLKTSASAGIPGYLVNYLYAEKLTYESSPYHSRSC